MLKNYSSTIAQFMQFIKKDTVSIVFLDKFPPDINNSKYTSPWLCSSVNASEVNENTDSQIDSEYWGLCLICVIELCRSLVDF